MKVVLLALALGLLLASPALAQPPAAPGELFLGAGDAGLIFELDDIAVSVLSLGNVSYGHERDGRQVVLGYQRQAGRWVSFGVTGSWAGSRKTMYVGGQAVGTVHRELFTLMGEGRVHWLRLDSVDLYSGMALGGSRFFDHVPGTTGRHDWSSLALHLIPGGIRFGHGVGAFFETGLGWRGFVAAGASARF